MRRPQSLHSDPAYARRCGYARPILHGLCTYGIVGRVLVHAACASDPLRVRALDATFTWPVVPGDTLTVLGWQEADACRFRALDGSGRVVLDGGTMVVAAVPLTDPGAASCRRER